MRGRRYRTIIRLMYAGGPLPDEDKEAFMSAMRSATGTSVADLEFHVSAHQYNVITVTATLRGTNPLDAITYFDTAVNRALTTMGQFEDFDVSGKILHVSPIELAD